MRRCSHCISFMCLCLQSHFSRYLPGYFYSVFTWSILTLKSCCLPSHLPDSLPGNYGALHRSYLVVYAINVVLRYRLHLRSPYLWSPRHFCFAYLLLFFCILFRRVFWRVICCNGFCFAFSNEYRHFFNFLINVIFLNCNIVLFKDTLSPVITAVISKSFIGYLCGLFTLHFSCYLVICLLVYLFVFLLFTWWLSFFNAC